MMQLKHVKYATLLLALVAALPAAARIPVAARRLSTNQTAITAHTDGRTIVWDDFRSGGLRNADIFGARLADGREFPVVNNERSQFSPMVDGDLVVWGDSPGGGNPNSDIRAKNLATGQEFVVAATPAPEGGPVIVGTRVFWFTLDRLVQGQGGPAIFMRDLATAAEPVRLIASRADWQVYTGVSVAVDQERIVWAEADAEPSAGVPARFRLLLRPLSGGQPALIGEGTITRSDTGRYTGLTDVDLKGDLLVYGTGAEVVVVNLRTGTTSRIGGQGIDTVTTDGRYVFWDEGAYPAANIHGYDTLTASSFAVTSTAAPVLNVRPDAAGGVLVWTQQVEGRGEIYAAAITDVLPNARQAAPRTPSPDVRYFAETGHTLAFGFKTFWERSGGLPVFGYPLTEEFTELNRDTGKPYTVQYVERQRYEYHPENANTPYTVLLGRLGVEALQRQGRDWQTFPKADSNAPHYFSATGHAIAPQFWDYWRTHGLEFGDRGVTEREALALFGYPISEPQMEQNSSGDTVLTQWFERARFEYHPTNPEPYKVLLGRLAADLLATRGW
jgi:hypothetical protein